MPGLLAIEATRGARIEALTEQLTGVDLSGWPVVLLVDDSVFAARHENNWLWATFTRSDPASDVHGVGAFMDRKHWGCTGPVIIDARWKERMAPPLEEDPKVSKRVDELAAPGGPLHGLY
jgi:4-hydroxy-3-polyprenylbenzoate decarboxylase